MGIQINSGILVMRRSRKTHACLASGLAQIELIELMQFLLLQQPLVGPLHLVLGDQRGDRLRLSAYSPTSSSLLAHSSTLMVGFLCGSRTSRSSVSR